MVDREVMKAVRGYLAGLRDVGIHPSRAVLFGSFARATGDEWSDIDLVVIAPEFDGHRDMELIQALWRMRASTDSRIEPIPCGDREWETDEGRPILEIARNEGVLIEL